MARSLVVQDDVSCVDYCVITCLYCRRNRPVMVGQAKDGHDILIPRASLLNAWRFGARFYGDLGVPITHVHNEVN